MFLRQNLHYKMLHISVMSRLTLPATIYNKKEHYENGYENSTVLIIEKHRNQFGPLDLLVSL